MKKTILIAVLLVLIGSGALAQDYTLIRPPDGVYETSYRYAVSNNMQLPITPIRLGIAGEYIYWMDDLNNNGFQDEEVSFTYAAIILADGIMWEDIGVTAIFTWVNKDTTFRLVMMGDDGSVYSVDFYYVGGW